MSLNDFKILQKLESKEEIILLKVKSKKDGLLYLLKNSDCKKLNKKKINNLIKEAKILSNWRHPNIIEFNNYFYDKNSYSFNLLMEYPYGVNISNKIKYAIKSESYLEEITIWEILTQILIGLNFLHKIGIVHRNLQSKKIFLSNQRLIKITDFDNCFKGKNINLIKDPIYTISYYSAPELLNGETYSFACDIWSVGCIIYEMATLSLPFTGNKKELLNNINNDKKQKPIPNFYSKYLKSIINDMLIVDKNKRLSTDMLLNYQYIKETANKFKLIYINYNNNKNNKILAKTNKKGDLQNSNVIQEEKQGLKVIKQDNKKDHNKKIIKEDLFSKIKSKILGASITPNNEYSYLQRKEFNKKQISLNNQNRKTVKNATYRTLKERTNLKKSLNERNFSSPSHYNLNIPNNNNFDKKEINLNNRQIQKNYKVGAYSFYDTNLNTFLNGKLLNKLKEKNANSSVATVNIKKNKNTKIKSVKKIDEKSKLSYDITSNQKINLNSINKKEFNPKRILGNFEIYINSPKYYNLSDIFKLNTSKELLPEEKNRLRDINFTDIQNIKLSDFETSNQDSSMLNSIRIKNHIKDYCLTSKDNKNNQSKSIIVNQNRENIISKLKNQKNCKNINNSKSEKQKFYDSLPKKQSVRITKIYNYNSNRFKDDLLNMDNSNIIKRPINFNDNTLNNIIRSKINKNHKKEFSFTNNNIDYFLGGINQLLQKEGIQLSSQKVKI